MIPRPTLGSWGLSKLDIDNLEKDPDVRNIVCLRDLIMSLYLRAVNSEKMNDEIWKKIDLLKNKSNILFACGFSLGLIIGVFINIF